MIKKLSALLLLALTPGTAAAQSTVVEYYHVDALGSVRAVTNQSGTVIRRHDYFPFGEEYLAQPGSDPLRFTGKERDAESGFDYFGARAYGSRMGRFTTVDPVMQTDEALTEPQRWNRYAYALNSPYRYIDPDGANPLLLHQLAQLVQRAASSPAAQRAQQIVVSQGSRVWVALTRLFNTPKGQELVRTAAELSTGSNSGPIGHLPAISASNRNSACERC